jgi:hypothetical protein
VKFSDTIPDALTQGNSTVDDYQWICEVCFGDFSGVEGAVHLAFGGFAHWGDGALCDYVCGGIVFLCVFAGFGGR